MKIALLAHNLRVAGGLSVGKNIVTALPVIAPMHDYLVIVPADCGYPDFADRDNVTVLPVAEMGPAARMRWEKNELRAALIEFDADWLWALGNFGLANPPCRQSVLFHLSHYIYPRRHRGYSLCESFIKIPRLWAQRRAISIPLGQTRRVYCQTETARQRFSRTFDYPLAQIGLCPNAVSSTATTITDAPDVLAPYKVRFKLFVLTKYYSHKNLERIVSMYTAHRDELRDTLCVITLHASHGPRARGLLARIEFESLGDLILNVGPIPQDRLSGYFSACDAMFLPTLLESFSGTYVEAMHFGRPILTSDLDFAHEVCGDAAFYFDPWNISDMKEQILRLQNDPALRKTLVSAGRKRMKSLLQSWPTILRRVLDQEEIVHD